MEVEKIDTRARLTEFLNLPYSIYKDYAATNLSLWIPPLVKDEKRLLSPGEHPFWNTAERELFIVRQNGVPLGRIAAIIDHKANHYAKEKAGAFGFFECANNPEAANALLEASATWLADKGMTFMRGPLNPSTNYTCGMLVNGFDKPPALMMPWNPPYYPELLENWHMRKEQDLLAYLIEKDKLSLPLWLEEELKNIKKEGSFEVRQASKKTLKEDVRAMLQIYRESWADNWGFSPLSPEEAEVLVKELTSILDPEFFIMFYCKGKPAAGMVALPDLNPLLKKINGRLGISALWHYWRLRKRLREGYRIMLFGILPRYRLQGLPMLLLDAMLNLAQKKPDFKWVEGSWVLEDNAAIDQLIEDFGGMLYKRYRIYRREIAPC